MDMLVGLFQIACIAGLLYGLYLTITCVGADEYAESCRRLKPNHFAVDPAADTPFIPTQVQSGKRLPNP